MGSFAADNFWSMTRGIFSLLFVGDNSFTIVICVINTVDD
jgi:hypothetical protein